jgi:hypothetical protein
MKTFLRELEASREEDGPVEQCLEDMTMRLAEEVCGFHLVSQSQDYTRRQDYLDY